MTKLNLKISFSGPLLKTGGKDIQRVAEQTVRDVMSFGEVYLNQRLRPRPSGVFKTLAEAGPKYVSIGNYRRNVLASVDFIRKPLGAVATIDDGNVLYGPWLEGISDRNKTTKFKGYNSFRKAAQEMQKNAGKLLRANVKRFTRKNR
jgi:hypothetical protein